MRYHRRFNIAHFKLDASRAAAASNAFPSFPRGGLSFLIPVIQPSISFALGSEGLRFGFAGSQRAAGKALISSSMVHPFNVR